MNKEKETESTTDKEVLRQAITETLEKNMIFKVAAWGFFFFAVIAMIALINGVVVAFELLPILTLLGLM